MRTRFFFKPIIVFSFILVLILLLPARIQAQTFSYVSNGVAHTAAIATSGSLWAWGFNHDGQLGDGTGGFRWDDHRDSPTQIGIGINWAAASASRSHQHPYANGGGYRTGCHTVAITTTGELWAWGSNSFGQLGIATGGIDNFSNIPVRVGVATEWKSVSATWSGTAAVKTDGSLWVWRGTSRMRWAEGGGLYDDPNASWETNIPIRVGTARNIVSVSAGGGGVYTIATDAILTFWRWR